MYIRETTWYRKQEIRENRTKWMRLFVLCFVMVLCVCFGVFLGSTLSFAQNENAGESVYYSEKTQGSSEYMLRMDGGMYLRASGPKGFIGRQIQMLTLGINMPLPSVVEIPVEIEVEELYQSIVCKQEIQSSSEEKITEQVDVNIVPSVDRKFRIVIDAGHGGEDEGCSFEEVEEKTVNLRLAKLLEEKLVDADYEVIVTRKEDEELTPQERVEIANRAEADAFISIHQNFCEERKVQGVEVWYGDGREDSERLAKLVEKYTVAKGKAKSRGIMSSDTLPVIRDTNMPSCLVETGFLSNNKERELLQDDAYLEKLAEGIVNGLQYYFRPKEMYLTFDDGPSKKNTEEILDILKKKDIKATFFVIGENVEKYPEIARRIVEEGHALGIHCYRHDYKEIYKDVDAYVEDFEKAKKVVLEATGIEAKLFRFPGGSINAYNEDVYEDIIKEMTGRGYIYFDWNASLEDAVRNPNADKLIQNAKESTLGRKKIVMLAHDTVDETAACLEELIGEFPEYEMKALDESVPPIQF